MPDTLVVDVNRQGLHTLEVDEYFEVDGPFTVELRNHGESTHAYLNLDDALSEVARIEATNHYVEADSRRRVTVDVRDPEAWPAEAVRGKLKVVIAHGQETRWVDVTLDSAAGDATVEVDPDLSTPQSGRETPMAPAVRVLPVAVLGAVAVILAVGSLFAADGIDTILGGFAVLTAALCAVAGYYML